MFVACGIWCLADVSSVSPSSELKQAKDSLIWQGRGAIETNVTYLTCLASNLGPVAEQLHIGIFFR